MRRANNAQIGLYRPGMATPFYRVQITVGREEILRDSLDHLRSATDRNSKHHFLFLGPRGIGKSHLLALIQDSIAIDPRLSTRIVVCRFPEESIGTLSFADLLKQLVSLLVEQLKDESEWEKLYSRIEAMEDDQKIVDTVVPILRRVNNEKKRTIVVMIENVNELFSKQIRKDQQIGAIRKFFMDKNGCLLIATAPMHFDAVTDVGRPFYDFFDTQSLQPFDKQQSVTLLRRMLTLNSVEESNDSSELSHVVMALHDLTGGNPRLMVMSCEMVVHEGHRSANELLLRLADRISPTYQAVLADLAPQERALLEAIASIRDTTPKTPANIANKIGISERQTSSLLNRLSEGRLVLSQVNPDDKRSRSYWIRDGFFDIWLALQSGSGTKIRIRALTDLLEALYLKKDGPFNREGVPNEKFLFRPWPPEMPRFESSDTTYLSFLFGLLKDWLPKRQSDIEDIACRLSLFGNNLFEVSVVKIMLKRLRASIESNPGSEQAPRLRTQAAYMHYLMNENNACLVELLAVRRDFEKDDITMLEIFDSNIAFVQSSMPAPIKKTERESKIFVSYAWGDETPEGRKREVAVNLLCSTLEVEGLVVLRDNHHLKPGDSIESFMNELSRGDKILCVLSDKYLKSEYCMVHELFQAYRRKNFQNTEFQALVVPVILDDAIDWLRNPEGRITLAKDWKTRADAFEMDLASVDPKSNSIKVRTLVNDMQEMATRIPAMLSAINDICVQRGFDALVESNFVDIVAILERTAIRADESNQNALQDSLSHKLADQLGARISKDLEEACLAEETNRIVDLFNQGMSWVQNGGVHASPTVRRSLLLRLANAILLDADDGRLDCRGLDEAVELLNQAKDQRSEPDAEFDALAIAISIGVSESQGDKSLSLDGLRAIDHPVSFANRIRIMLNREQTSDALDLVHHRSLHVRWAEIATAIYARSNRLSDAIQICEGMRTGTIEGQSKDHSPSIRYFRCLRILANEVYSQVFRGRSEHLHLYPDTLNDLERSQMMRVLEILNPIIQKVSGAGAISNGIESGACETAADAAWLLGDQERAEKLSKLLATAIPIPRGVIQAIKRGLTSINMEILHRLQLDWPRDQQVCVSVCELAAMRLHQSEIALDKIEAMDHEILNENLLERLSSVLLHVYQTEMGTNRNRAFSMLSLLFGSDHAYLRMAEAIGAIERDEWERAEQLLSDRPALDDPDWLNMRATVLYKLGKPADALAALKHLTQMTSYPDVLWKSFAIAIEPESRDMEFGISILERLTKFIGEQERARPLLAEKLFELGTDESVLRASILFEELYRLAPSKPSFGLRAAGCFRHLRKVDQALTLLAEVRKDHPTLMEGIMLEAEILETEGRADEAYALVSSDSVKGQFWDNIKFLHHFMHLGYRTNHELEANQAMLRIRSLEEGKEEPQRTLHEQNQQQLIDFLKSRHQLSQQVDQMVVQGRSPWTWQPFDNHVSIHAAWEFRTRKLIPWETLAGRAHYSTYASNSYFLKAQKELRQIESIEPPPALSPIVADVSSLLTLFKLGLLQKVSDHFGTIYVPAVYREIEIFEAKRLQPHQRRLIDQSHRLYGLLVDNRLRRPRLDVKDTVVVDFNADRDSTSVSVANVTDWLARSGHLSRTLHNNFLTAHNLVVTERTDVEVSISSHRTRFTLFAIQTLDSDGILDVLLENCKVTLTQDAVSELEQEQYAFQQQSRIARSSREFWTEIRDNSKIQFANSQNRSKSTDADDESDEVAIDGLRMALAASELAKSRELPLLADDRVLITVCQNESDSRSCVASSTLELLASLEKHGVISKDEQLQSCVRLVDWRYRFMLVDDQLLLHAAKKSIETGAIPGPPLLKIARYVQDCMIDIGLFGGNESVVPPRSMAWQLFASWTGATSRFINKLWLEENVTDQDAERFTRWAIDSLLPRVPSTVRPDIQIHMAEFQAKLVLTYVLSDRALNPNTARSAKLMTLLQDALGMSQSEFCRSVFGLIDVEDDGDGIEATEEQWKKIQLAMRRGIARHALSPFRHDGGYQLDARGIALMEASNSVRKKPMELDAPEYILDLLRDPTNSLLLNDLPPGPLVFHRVIDTQHSSMFEATDLLVHPHHRAREATVAYFKNLAINPTVRVATLTKTSLTMFAKQIAKKKSVNWYPVAEELLHQIEQDWQLNLAGFGQALRALSQELIHKYWIRCIRPMTHPAISLPPTAFSACIDETIMERHFAAEVRSANSISDSIESFCDQLGHLPLDGKWTLSQFLLNRLNAKLPVGELLQLSSQPEYHRAFQGCSGLATSWDLLSEAEKAQAAASLSKFICLSHGDDLTSREGRYWACLKRLASHYLLWIPLYGPELGDDNSASLAWWMARRLTDIVTEDIESKEDEEKHAKSVLNRNIDPLVQYSFMMNQLVRGGATNSIFHSNTHILTQGGPYFVSLIAGLGQSFARIYPSLDENAKAAVDHWMTLNTIHRPLGAPQHGSLLYTTYSANLEICTSQWQEAIHADAKTVKDFSELRSNCEILGDAKELEELLSEFDQFEESDRSMWLDRIKVAIWRQSLQLDPIQSLFRSRLRCKQFIGALSLEQLSTFIELILSMQQIGDTDWRRELPHRLVEWLDMVESSEAKALIFNGIVCSSIAGESPTALDEVRARDDIGDLRNSFHFQRDRIEAARDIVPRWAWSRLRVFLDRLHVTS